MRPTAVWEFIAGDSRIAPAAVAVAVVVTLIMLRAAAPNAAVAITFVALIALGLTGAVFERR
jgi:hypothetical protein